MLYRSLRGRLRLIYDDLNHGRIEIALKDLKRLRGKLGNLPVLDQVEKDLRAEEVLTPRDTRDRLRLIPRRNYPEISPRRVQVPH